jgi:hypothetical protein
MKRIMKFAAFAFLVSSYPALAEEGNGTGPVRLNAPRVETPPPVIKPKLIRSPPVAGNVGAGQDAPRPQSRTDQPPLSGVKQQPSRAVQQVRPRVAHRELSRRIDIAGGVLALPKVEYYGVRSSLMCQGWVSSMCPRTNMLGFTRNCHRRIPGKWKRRCHRYVGSRRWRKRRLRLMSAGRKEPDRVTYRI